MFDIISFIPRAVMQGIPLLLGSTGETLTEKSGNLNLGIPGIMYVGGICGVIGSVYYEMATLHQTRPRSHRRRIAVRFLSHSLGGHHRHR